MNVIMLSIAVFVVFAAFLLWYLIHFDRGEKETARAILIAMAFGVLAITLTLPLEEMLNKIPAALRDSGMGVALIVFMYTLGIGLIEEGTKFVPQALYIKSQSYFNEHTDGVFYFAITGMMFGLIEDIVYAFRGGGDTAAIPFTHIMIPAVLMRIVIGGFFHGATTGIIGYYYSRAKLQGQSLAMTIVAFLSMVAIHGLFDFGLMYPTFVQQLGGNESFINIMIVMSLMYVPLLNLGLFLYYMKANEHDVERGLAYDSKHGGVAAQPIVQASAPAAPTQAPPAA